MKKNTFVLCLLFLSIMITGCDGQGKVEESKNPTASPTPPISPTPIASDSKTEGERTLLSEYETKIVDKVANRTNNLNICAKTLNGVVVKPGEEFSFNNTVGERTSKKGYLKAITFDENGDKKKEIGGGICQISTTLHMAAKTAGLNITERHDHKREIPYEKIGNDAAISYGAQDFKFINNREYSIQINVTINEQKSVIVKLYKI